MSDDAAVQQWYGVAYKEARFYVGRVKNYKEFEFDDLFQVAKLGVVKALNSYDSAKGTILHTHVTNCVRNSICEYLRQNKGGIIHIPRNAAKKPPTVNSLDATNHHQAIMKQPLETEVSIELSRALDILEPRWRHCVTRVFLEGYTYLDVAQEIGVCESRVYQIVQASFKKIRKEFGNFYIGDDSEDY